ncbi:hypothetical protein, partial [Streptomyces sp. WAC05858]|uniref:hypothetical protein n=1 Tax=Streptomyces sp. WAC05858 TaxID=2487409 RepID=UPI001C8E2E6B
MHPVVVEPGQGRGTGAGAPGVADGVTGLIKAVLCLGRGLIPPNPHFTRWNPTIDADGTRLFIPRE